MSDVSFESSPMVIFFNTRLDALNQFFQEIRNILKD